MTDKSERLAELRKKFGRELPKTPEQEYYDSWYNSPEEVKFRSNLSRWKELTKDWNKDDIEWAWNFIAGASQPRG